MNENSEYAVFVEKELAEQFLRCVRLKHKLNNEQALTARLLAEERELTRELADRIKELSPPPPITDKTIGR